MYYKKISAFSFIVFHSFVYYTFVNSFIIPHLIQSYGKESFIYPLLFIFIGIIVIAIYNPFTSRHVKQYLINSKIPNILLRIYLLIFSTVLIYAATTVIKQFYPTTSIFVFYFFILVTASFIAYYGINTIINLSTPIFVLFPVLFILPAFIAEREFNHLLIFPFMFNKNIIPLLLLLVIPLDMIISTIFGEDTKKEHVKRTHLIISLSITFLFVAINIYSSIITFSIGFLKEVQLPGYIIYDSLKISKNFDNYDVMLLLFVTTTTCFKVAYNLNLLRLLSKVKCTWKNMRILAIIQGSFLVLIYVYRINVLDYIPIILISLIATIIFPVFYIIKKGDTYVPKTSE